MGDLEDAIDPLVPLLRLVFGTVLPIATVAGALVFVIQPNFSSNFGTLIRMLFHFAFLRFVTLTRLKTTMISRRNVNAIKSKWRPNPRISTRRLKPRHCSKSQLDSLAKDSRTRRSFCWDC